jgi:hypothetical protein
MTMPAPHRRHRLRVDLEADSLEVLVGVLHYLADEIEVGERDDRELRSSGHSVVYHATLSTDPLQTGDRYRRQRAEWEKRG